jgi:hypothetical protein
MIHSTMVEGQQRHGNRQIRLDLLNGMRIAALATVTDEPRTMLLSGLAIARTNGGSVIAALPLSFLAHRCFSAYAGYAMGLECSQETSNLGLLIKRRQPEVRSRTQGRRRGAAMARLRCCSSQ